MTNIVKNFNIAKKGLKRKNTKQVYSVQFKVEVLQFKKRTR